MSDAELELLNDNRPIRYEEVDESGAVTVIYRASAIGGCIRALVAAGSAYTPTRKPEWFLNVLDEGTRMEKAILAQTRQKTDVATTRQQEKVELDIGMINGRRVIVRGHIDGARGLEPVLREAKKFRPSTWPKFMRQGVEVSTFYPWQVSALMFAGGFESCEFIGGQYDPKTDSIKNIHIKQLAQPPIPLKAIKLKVAKIERLIGEGKHPTTVPCSDPLMYPCGYFYLHDEKDDEDEGEEAGEIEAITDPGLVELVVGIGKIAAEKSEWDRLSREAGETLKSMYASLRGELKVGEKDEGKKAAGGFTVEYGLANRAGYTVDPIVNRPFINVKPTKKGSKK